MLFLLDHLFGRSGDNLSFCQVHHHVALLTNLDDFLLFLRQFTVFNDFLRHILQVFLDVELAKSGNAQLFDWNICIDVQDLGWRGTNLLACLDSSLYFLHFSVSLNAHITLVIRAEQGFTVYYLHDLFEIWSILGIKG